MSRRSTSPHATTTSGSLVRFLLIGGLSYVVDLGVLLVVRDRLDAPLAAATTAGYATGFVVNFGLNRVWAFRSSSPAGPQVGRYVLLVLANYLLTLAIVLGLTRLGAAVAVAKTVSTVVLAAVNFAAYRWWVFR